MVSSSSLRSENESLGQDIDRICLVGEILARGVVRYRRGNAGEFTKTHRSAVREIAGVELACIASGLGEENQ